MKQTRSVRRYAVATLLFVCLLAPGLVAQGPFSAQIQRALQGLGLWPYDGSYTNTQVPIWNAAQGKFIAGSAGAGGDVVGPAASTDNAIVRFDGTTGKIIQNYTSGAPTIGDTGALAMAAPITITGGTVTVSTPLLNLTQTFNGAGVVFNGILLNVTNTASAGSAKLLQLQVGGASFFEVEAAVGDVYIGRTNGNATLRMGASGAGMKLSQDRLYVNSAATMYLGSNALSNNVSINGTSIGFYTTTPITQGASIADATGGAIIDAEARTALNALISRIEALGLIATTP